MRIVCTGRGSRGDVHPILDIATGLQRCGHRVTVSVARSFEPEVHDRGLDARYFEEDTAQLMRRFGSGLHSARVALRWVSDDLEKQLRELLELTRGADALVAGATQMSAPAVAEYRKIPYYRVAFAPILPGDQPPPFAPWQTLPRAINRVLWRGLNGAIGLLMRKFLSEQRRKLGLRRLERIEDYFAGQGRTILAISPWLAPPSGSWRHKFSYTGYCHGEDGQPLTPALSDFLEAGPPPVYIGFGSVSVDDPVRFTGKVLAAARRAGCRLILGKGWTGLGGRRLPVFAFQVDEIPHQSLFPRVAAVAHHGGSGTTHTAARAGVPQFVMPQIADQYYWGARLHALGIGPAPRSPRRLGVRELSLVFRRLTDDPGLKARARAVARGVRRERGLERAVKLIDTLQA